MGTSGYAVASMLISVAFLIIAIASALRQVVFGTEITLNRLVGAFISARQARHCADRLTRMFHLQADT